MNDFEITRKIANALGWKFTEHRYAPWWTGNGYVDAPDWINNISDASDLVKDVEYFRLVKTKYAEGYSKSGTLFLCEIGYPDREPGGFGEADTASRAICLAWLAWKQAQVDAREG